MYCPLYLLHSTCPATGAHKVPCRKDLCISHVDLLRMANFEASCLRKVSTLLNLLEQGLHWLLRVPCPAHLLKIVFQINSCDSVILKKEVLKHLSGRDVSAANHSVIQDLQVHWLKTVIICFLSSCCTVLCI
jgi:hypothetical protein